MPVVNIPEPFSLVGVRAPDGHKLTDEEYWDFCMANQDLHIERTAKGEIVIAPPAGGELDYRNAYVITELMIWARQDGRGKAFGPTVQYFLSDGSGFSPDASWVSNENLAALTKAERKKFLRLTPEFVIEVLSPTDRLKTLKAKLETYIANGVALGWLIDGDAETVHIHEVGKPVKTRRHPKELRGSGPVDGFVLDLVPIWRGL